MDSPRDCVIPFMFEHLDIRGAWVSLDQTWAGLTRGRDYPVPVAHLLGEMAGVTALIGANLKQPGRLTFQLRGDVPQAQTVELLVMDCDEQLRMRGMARWQGDRLPEDAPALLGHGKLVLSLDTVGMRQPYQSVVPLEGASLAAIFEHYLTRSEQQPTRLALASDAMRATGLFLQRLPGADEKDPDGWNRIQHLLETLKPAELLALPATDLLRSLFPEEDIRVFDPRPVTHHCPQDWEKIHTMLKSLGREECDAILRDHGQIHVRDDICDLDYHLDAQAVAALFEPPSSTVH
ncbi:MAG: Hsp33 family molecular chaperone HslO [Pseudomonadota bacterium]